MLASMEDLIPIGQFAAASRLSPKALRLYDENGLLPPARVDPESGYRYYRRLQLRQATMIRLLRRTDMPLADIRAFLADGNRARLEEHERRLVDDLRDRRLILRYLKRRLEEDEMFTVETKSVEAQPYVGRSGRVHVRELEGFLIETMAELKESAEATAPAFAIYHGEVNEDDDGPVEVGVPTAAGDRTLPAGEVAFTVARGEQCLFPSILGAYEAVASWAQENGRELAGSPREVYHQGPGGDEVVEIAWPIR